MNNSHLNISAVVAAVALLVPAGAIAKRPENKPAKEKTPKVKVASANVKGVVTANDGVTLTVMVAKASGQVKACKGKELTFDLANARFHTADHDADGDMDAADVRVGDAVKVQGKVALSRDRKATCAGEGLVLPAKRVQNRTPLAIVEADEVEEADETDDVEDGEETEEVEETEDEETSAG